jgi:hypothetical protein
MAPPGYPLLSPMPLLLLQALPLPVLSTLSERNPRHPWPFHIQETWSKRAGSDPVLRATSYAQRMDRIVFYTSCTGSAAKRAKYAERSDKLLAAFRSA